MKYATRILLAGLAASLSLPGALPLAHSQQTQSEDLDEVLVTGELPGPAMWRVSKDDHTMWIVGTLEPLPEKMTWRSQQVEGVIGHAAEILGGYSERATIEGGWFRAMRLLPAVMRLRYNSDGATLQQALPAEVYERYKATHRRFFGKDPDPKDRTRPAVAADTLFDRALKKSGLSLRNVVWPVVTDLAKRHKVRIRQREFVQQLDDPKGLIADIAAMSREKEVTCLLATMDRIDNDLANMQRRAKAWAVGDVGTLRALPHTRHWETCIEAVLEKPRLRKLYEEQQARVEADRPAIVAYMLLAHETSFTTLPIEDLLDPKGSLAKFRAAGYTVEEPD